MHKRRLEYGNLHSHEIHPPNPKKLREQLQKPILDRLSSTQSKVRSRLATPDGILNWKPPKQDKKEKQAIAKSQNPVEIIDVDALDQTGNATVNTSSSRQRHGPELSPTLPMPFVTPSSHSIVSKSVPALDMQASMVLAERTRNADLRLQQMYPTSLQFPSKMSTNTTTHPNAVPRPGHRQLPTPMQSATAHLSKMSSNYLGLREPIKPERPQDFVDLTNHKIHSNNRQFKPPDIPFNKESNGGSNQCNELSSLYHLYHDLPNKRDRDTGTFSPSRKSYHHPALLPNNSVSQAYSVPSAPHSKSQVDINKSSSKQLGNPPLPYPNPPLKPLSAEQARVLQNCRLAAAANRNSADMRQQQKPLNNTIRMTPEEAGMVTLHLKSQQRELERKLEELKDLERRVNASTTHGGVLHLENSFSSQLNTGPQNHVSHRNNSSLHSPLSRKPHNNHLNISERERINNLHAALMGNGNRVPSSFLAPSQTPHKQIRSLPSSNNALNNVCPVCRQSARFICSGCHRVWYCSQNCQVSFCFAIHIF